MTTQRPSPGRRTRSCALGLAIAVSAAIATPCAAQVIEIAPDGGAVTYTGPNQFTDAGATSLAAAARPQAPQALAPAGVRSALSDAAVRQGLDPALLGEVAWQESRFQPGAISARDAVGVMQLTAGAARDMGVDRFDPVQNIHGGAAYLRRLLDRYGGDLRLALAAYNAGPGAVDRYRGVPPFAETTAYVDSILGRLALRALASAMSPARQP